MSESCFNLSKLGLGKEYGFEPDEIKGNALCAFVTLEGSNMPSEELKDELKEWVVKEIGALARPDEI